jgi:AraC family L-rhamnose operon regulatory protein RhaS
MDSEHCVLFKAGDTTHRADDCLPLVQAVEEGRMTLHALARGHYPGERLKAAEVPGVCSVGYWQTLGNLQHGLSPHRNEGVEVTMPLQGETPVMVDRKGFVLHTGEVMITRPWQLHSVGEPCFAKGKVGWLILDVGVRHPHQAWRWPEWVSLSAGDLGLLTRSLRQNEDGVREASAELRDAFIRLVSIPAGDSALFRGSRIAVAVSDLLLRLLELFHSNPVRLRPALMESSRSVRLYVQELDAHAIPRSVETMADACGLGVTRFSALFKEVTGATPGDYLLRRRLDEACRLLKGGEGLSVEAIGQRVGFSHGNYFARVFRRAFGATPGAWREAVAPK